MVNWLCLILVQAAILSSVNVLEATEDNNGNNLAMKFMQENTVLNCKSLMTSRFEVGWSFLDGLTMGVRLSLLDFEPGSWFAFGLSGSNESSFVMTGANVYMFFYPMGSEESLTEPTVRLYNISGSLPCTVNELYPNGYGVCESSQQDAVLFNVTKNGNVTSAVFAAPVLEDGENQLEGPIAIIWATGHLNDAENSPSSIQVHQETIEENIWIDFFKENWECSFMEKANISWEESALVAVNATIGEANSFLSSINPTASQNISLTTVAYNGTTLAVPISTANASILAATLTTANVTMVASRPSIVSTPAAAAANLTTEATTKVRVESSQINTVTAQSMLSSTPIKTISSVVTTAIPTTSLSKTPVSLPTTVTTTASTAVVTTAANKLITAPMTTSQPPKTTPKTPSLYWPVAQCKKLVEKKYEVGWTISGDTIFIQYHLLIKPNQWFAFGWSGDSKSARMLNSDLVVFFMPFITDPQVADYLTPPTVRSYRISAVAPCNATDSSTGVGVCESARQSVTLVGTDITPTGYIMVRFSRPLDTGFPDDRQIRSGKMSFIWAKGPLKDGQHLPSSLLPHTEMSANAVSIDFYDMNERSWDCRMMVRLPAMVLESLLPNMTTTTTPATTTKAMPTTTPTRPATTVPAVTTKLLTTVAAATIKSNVSLANTTVLAKVGNASIEKEGKISGCKSLVSDKFEVAWALGNGSVSFQYNIILEPGYWFGFGFSGNNVTSKMLHGDAFVFSYKNLTSATVRSYKFSATRYCNETTGVGACPRTNQSDIALEEFSTYGKAVTVRFNLSNSDFRIVRGLVPIIWAKGVLRNDSSINVHSEKLRGTFFIDFFDERAGNGSTCSLLTNKTNEVKSMASNHTVTTTPTVKRVRRQSVSLAWNDIPTIENQIHFVVTLGPTGGNVRGYSAIRNANSPDNDMVFYVNGLLSPDIHLIRNTTYYFFPLTGFDYPVYITDDPVGGYAFLDSRRRSQVRVYSGIDGNGMPSMIGLYCAYQSNSTQSLIDQLPTYASFFSTLNLGCSPTNNRTMATYFAWTPSFDTPSVLYYQAYTKRNMGGQILISDY